MELSFDLERAGRFSLRLDREGAPAASRTLLEQAPLSVVLCHSIFSGEALEGELPVAFPPVERPAWFGIAPGSVGIETSGGGRARLVLVYGPTFQYRHALAPLGAPLHLIGRLEGDLQALFRGGKQYQEKGEGSVRLGREGEHRG